jgi:hypothetical protein
MNDLKEYMWDNDVYANYIHVRTFIENCTFGGAMRIVRDDTMYTVRTVVNNSISISVFNSIINDIKDIIDEMNNDE